MKLPPGTVIVLSYETHRRHGERCVRPIGDTEIPDYPCHTPGCTGRSSRPRSRCKACLRRIGRQRHITR